MLIEKNRHLEAASALLGNRSQGLSMIRALESRPENSFHFIAQASDVLDNVILLLRNPGATTTFIVTSPIKNNDIAQCSSLIKEAAKWLSKTCGTNDHLAQTVMHPNESHLRQAFHEAGFEHLAILTCMEQNKPSKRIKIPDNLQFIPITPKDDELLGQILQETYLGSLDCPKIHGLRQIQDIIDGHRSINQTETQLWSIAELGGVTSGVVLLNASQITRCLEIAYVGITPSSRGKGLGNYLMQHIANQAFSVGVNRITLAVDSKNSPAIGLYKKWNFKKTKQLCTMIHKLS